MPLGSITLLADMMMKCTRAISGWSLDNQQTSIFVYTFPEARVFRWRAATRWHHCVLVNNGTRRLWVFVKLWVFSINYSTCEVECSTQYIVTMAKAVLETTVTKQKSALKNAKVPNENSEKFPVKHATSTTQCKSADKLGSVGRNVHLKVPHRSSNLTTTDTLIWWFSFVAVTCVSLGSRLHKITEPPQVW